VRSCDKYYTFAAECLRLSRVVEDLQSKAIFLQMATTWLNLAERLKAKESQEAA
jgi:hypothetical protein